MDLWPNHRQLSGHRRHSLSRKYKRIKQKRCGKQFLCLATSVEVAQNISEVIQLDRFSSLDGLIRVTALVLKFIKRTKKRSMEIRPELSLQQGCHGQEKVREKQIFQGQGKVGEFCTKRSEEILEVCESKRKVRESYIFYQKSIMKNDQFE